MASYARKFGSIRFAIYCRFPQNVHPDLFQGDIILLSLRDYQDEKGDVILKYSADEARSLKAYGELPETAKINETDT